MKGKIMTKKEAEEAAKALNYVREMRYDFIFS